MTDLTKKFSTSAKVLSWTSISIPSKLYTDGGSLYMLDTEIIDWLEANLGPLGEKWDLCQNNKLPNTIGEKLLDDPKIWFKNCQDAIWFKTVWE